ncbi:hypothetical protein TRFO_26568 [Tritrichomonas foetus]|uniref:Importin N-terminal domain-containing protein n=1 Tax=Tritrichomonas foetus TaxID=1144522 RepID=A0A1J4K858_9EUKA|nr:hypothetical protein TRFO_26568 [Tritrichomonas foetus]|eukprot:OHT05621.1 hypothetical protein TRFO_26568 [Tritrichomonas foetus]
MAISPEILEAALNQLYTSDQNAIMQAQEVIQSVQNLPDGIIIFLQIILTTQNPASRKPAITCMISIVEKQWANLPEPVKEQARNLIIQVIQMDLKLDELSMMADICAIIFKSMGFWNEIIKLICVAYQNQNHTLTMLFLSKIFPVMPNTVIEQSYQAFKNMAYYGLKASDQDTNLYAAQIFVTIAKKISNPSILEPLFQYLIPELMKSPSYPDHVFKQLWGFVGTILSINGIDNSIIMELFQVAIHFISENSFDVDKRHFILDEFTPVVPFVAPEMLNVMLSLSFVLALTYISAEEQLPDDYFSILEKALSTRTNEIADFIKGKVVENLNNSQSLPNVILGLCILRPLLQYATDSMVSEIELIQKSLQSALSVPQELIQRAALLVINVFDESFDGLSDISITLMQSVIPLLISPNKAIRNNAANAFLSLCELCDTEIDGLFNTLWSLHINHSVPPNSYDDYILILARVLQLSQDITDEELSQVLAFIEGVFANEEQIVEKAISLNVLSALFTKNSSLHNTLLPKIIPVLNSSLTYQNEDVICQALVFLTNLVKSYRKEVLPFVSNYFSYIVEIISEMDIQRRCFLRSMNTAASIIKFCDDTTLIPPLTKAIIELFYDSDLNTIIDVCNFIAMTSRQLAQVQSEAIKPIFTALVKIVKERNDNDLFNASLEALSKLFKRCRRLEPPYFDQISQDLINCVFTGKILLLGNDPQKLFDLPSENTGYLLDFIDVYLRVQPPNANEIYNVLLQWMSKSDEIVVVPIIGAITETLKRTNIDVQILTGIIQYLQGIAPNVTDVQLRQNISYFLSTFLFKFQDQVPLISQFIPILNAWWEDGKTKAVGYQHCFSNIAVLYLRLFVNGAQLPIPIVISAIEVFPPADETETENMADLIIHILSNQQIPDLFGPSCISIANLLTKPPTNKNMKKISQETLGKLQQLFRTIVSANETIKNHLLQLYSKNQEKQQIISQYF